MLEVSGLTAGYGGRAVLKDVSMRVGTGQLIALLGANNAGKTTLINCLSRLVKPMAGKLRLLGEDVTGASPMRMVELGLVQVPEGRLIFPAMSVRENLLLGGINPKSRKNRPLRIEMAFDLFPRLKERSSQLAGTLSGGEQQMLAIARGLMAEPKLLLLDEPSLGLSPLFVQYAFEAIDRLRREGLTILLVEQNLNLALRYADHCYVLERGEIAVEGTPDTIRHDPRTRSAYLGL